MNMNDNQTTTPPVDLNLKPMNLNSVTEQALNFFNSNGQGEGSTVLPSDNNPIPTTSTQNGLPVTEPIQPLDVQNQPTDINNANTQLQPSANDQLILGKFKSVEDLENAYKNLEKDYTKKTQTLADIMLNNMQQSAQQGSVGNDTMQQPQQLIPPQMQQQSELADIPSDAEGFLAKFYADPLTMIKTLVNHEANKNVSQAIAPIQQRFEHEDNKNLWNQRANEFLNNVPTAKEKADDIIQVLNDIPHLQNDPRAFYIAHDIVVGRNGVNQKTPDVNPEALVKDPQFLENYIINNPDIKNKIIAGHLQDVKNSSATTPPLMTSTSGANIASPVQKPANFRQAGDMLLEMLNQK